MIPVASDGWHLYTVEDIAAPEPFSLVGNTFGSRLKASEYTSTGVPVLRGNNLSGPGRFNDEGTCFVSEAKADELFSQNAIADDVIFTQQGSVGQVGIIPHDTGFRRWVVSQSQMKLRPDRRKALPLYVYFYFRQAHVVEQLQNLAIVTGVPHINLGILRKFPILLPPVGEQRLILDIIGTLDDNIELNRHMSRTLESIVRALFHSWFVDFDPVRALMEGRQPFGMDVETAALFPCAFAASSLGQVPAGWAVEPIGDCVRVVGGTTPSTGNATFWEGGHIHWTTPKDLSLLSNRALLDTERKITQSGLQQIGSGLLPKGTVLMSSRAPIGYLAIAEVSVAINQGFIAMICDGPVPNHYVLNWTEANMDIIEGRANGTTFQEISKASFRPIPMLVPPKPILDRFYHQAEALHRKLVSNLQQSETLAVIRDTLLPKLMSGEVRVHDAEKTVEEAL